MKEEIKEVYLCPYCYSNKFRWCGEDDECYCEKCEKYFNASNPYCYFISKGDSDDLIKKAKEEERNRILTILKKHYKEIGYKPIYVIGEIKIISDKLKTQKDD